MSLNFPKDPTEGDTWDDAPNGIPYIYQNGKWEVYLKPSDNINHWVREIIGTGQDTKGKLSPRASDDLLSVKTYDIDRLGNLPASSRNAFSRFVIGYVDGDEYRGYFHILVDGVFMSGLQGDPNTQRIYATRAESLMAMPGYTPPEGAVVPDPTPMNVSGYTYVSDDGTLIGGGY
jgi:hypothetical protein